MKILDLAQEGYLPIQHFVKEDGTPLPLRQVLFGVRMESEPDDDGRYKIDKAGGGDIKGAVLWPAKDREDLHSFWFAAPAVLSEQNVDPQRRVSKHGVSQDEVIIGGRRMSTSVRKKKRPAKALPVRDGEWAPDTRYDEIDVIVPKGGPYPKDTPGVVISASRDDEEQPLFFPVGETTLAAINVAGDPADGSLVRDHDPADPTKLSEDDYAARLQSMMRVLRMGPTCAGGGGPSIAWQLGTSALDGLSGIGLGVSGSVPSLKDPSQEIENTPVDKESKPRRPVTHGGRDVNAPPPDQMPSSRHGAVTRVDDYQRDLNARLNGATQADPSTSTVIGGVTVLGPNGALGPTSVRPGKKLIPPPPDIPPPPKGGLIAAFFGAVGGGPLHVGHERDQHRVGLTLDGEAVNQGHVDCRAPFYLDRDYDAAIDFENEPYEASKDAPFKVRGHIRMDFGDKHPTPCGPRIGKWKVESSSYFSDPGDKPPPRIPPPEEGPGVILIPSPKVKIVIEETEPIIDWIGDDPTDLRKLGQDLRKLAEDNIDGLLGEQSQPGGPVRAEAATQVSAPSIALHAQATGYASKVVARGAAASAEILKDLALAPHVANFLGFASGTQRNGEFDYANNPRLDPDAVPAASGGGAIFAPPGMSVQDALDQDESTALSTARMFFPIMSSIDFGWPSAATGSCEDGIRAQVTSTGGLDVKTIGTDGATGSNGIEMDTDGNVNIAGSLTVNSVPVTGGGTTTDLDIDTAAVTVSSTTAETNGQTYSVAADTLATNGDMLVIRGQFTCSGAGALDDVNFDVGGTTIDLIGGSTSVNGTCEFEVRVIRTAAGTQDIYSSCWGAYSNAAGPVAGTEDETASITLALRIDPTDSTKTVVHDLMAVSHKTIGTPTPPAAATAVGTPSGFTEDGSDGSLTVSADSSVTGDKQYTTVTVNTTYKLHTEPGFVSVYRATGDMVVNGTVFVNGKGEASI